MVAPRMRHGLAAVTSDQGQIYVDCHQTLGNCAPDRPACPRGLVWHAPVYRPHQIRIAGTVRAADTACRPVAGMTGDKHPGPRVVARGGVCGRSVAGRDGATIPRRTKGDILGWDRGDIAALG